MNLDETLRKKIMKGGKKRKLANSMKKTMITPSEKR